MKCLTFGSPQFADENAMELYEKLSLCGEIYHFVNEGDLVAAILCYPELFEEDLGSRQTHSSLTSLDHIFPTMQSFLKCFRLVQ